MFLSPPPAAHTTGIDVELGVFVPGELGLWPPARRRMNPGYLPGSVVMPHSGARNQSQALSRPIFTCRTACVGSGGAQFPGLSSHVLEHCDAVDHKCFT